MDGGGATGCAGANGVGDSGVAGAAATGISATGAGEAGAAITGISGIGAGATGAVTGASGAAGAPSACGVGTLRTALARRVLGLPLANASGLPATRIAIICGVLMVGDEGIFLAMAAKVSPGLTGP